MVNNKELIDKFMQTKDSDVDAQKILDLLRNPDFGENLYEENWTRANGVIPESVDRRLSAKVRSATRAKFSVQWQKVWNLVAVFMLFLGIGVILYQWRELEISNCYSDVVISVPKGQRNEVVLPDGTHVLLNSGSQIKYGRRFNARERRVELEGEAHFDVAKNPGAPFSVFSDDISVTALGTRFDVRAYKSEKVISSYLEEGKILVKSPTESIEMRYPNQCIYYDRDSKKMQKVDVEDAEYFIAWRKGRLTFRDETLMNIAKLLEQQYSIKIDFKDKALASRRFSGTIENYNLTNILEILGLASDIRYEFRRDTLILSMK